MTKREIKNSVQPIATSISNKFKEEGFGNIEPSVRSINQTVYIKINLEKEIYCDSDRNEKDNIVRNIFYKNLKDMDEVSILHKNNNTLRIGFDVNYLRNNTNNFTTKLNNLIKSRLIVDKFKL